MQRVVGCVKFPALGIVSITAASSGDVSDWGLLWGPGSGDPAAVKEATKS